MLDFYKKDIEGNEKKNIDSFKMRYVAILMILVAFLFYIFYIHRSAGNIVYMDQLRILDIVDKYFSGNLKAMDLWAPYLQHRIFGYRLIFLVNAIFFHLNTFFEMYLGAVMLCVICIFIYLEYEKSFYKYCLDKKKMLIFFIITCIVFGLQKWEVIVLSMGVNMYIQIILDMAIFSVLNNILTKGESLAFLLVKLSIFILLFIMFFSGAYYYACLGSVIVILFMNIYLNKEERKKSIFLIYIVGVVSIIGLKIYSIGMNTNNEGIYEPITKQIYFLCSHFFDALKFYVLSLAGSIVGVETAEVYLNLNIMLGIGFILLSIYFFSIIIFVLNKLYKKTYMPLFLIMYTLIFCVLILVGRLNYGIDYGMSSRYMNETQYGLIGVLWIISLLFDISNEKKRYSYYITSVVIFVILGQLSTNFFEWQKGPYRKIAYERMRTIALKSTLTEDDTIIFQSDPYITRKGIEILKKYNLNVFYDYSNKIGH